MVLADPHLLEPELVGSDELLEIPVVPADGWAW
jgi:hypothetical protein